MTAKLDWQNRLDQADCDAIKQFDSSCITLKQTRFN